MRSGKVIRRSSEYRVSIVDLNPKKKIAFAHKAVDKGELTKDLAEYKIKIIIFDTWITEVNLFEHRW